MRKLIIEIEDGSLSKFTMHQEGFGNPEEILAALGCVQRHLDRVQLIQMLKRELDGPRVVAPLGRIDIGRR